MNFLFVDQILSANDTGNVVGIKHVTADDCYLQQDSHGEWVLMSCIVGEALGQLAAWEVMAHHDFKLRPVAGVVGEVEILGQARLGDTIILESQIERLDEEVVHYNSEARVADNVILRLHNALGPFVPLSDLSDASEVQRQYNMINRHAELPAVFEAGYNSQLQPHQIVSARFDKIIAWQRGESARAVKLVSGLAPYFVDHFPRKPVLPLSILLQCKVNLAQAFIEDMLGEAEAKHFQPQRLRRIKMKEFVEPGMTVTTDLTLKKHTEDNITLRFESHAGTKRIAMTDIIFNRQ